MYTRLFTWFQENKTTNTSTSEKEVSSFNLHYDGFSFKGYSVRLSNLNVKKIPANYFRLFTWAISLGVVDTAFVGLTASNQITHYIITGSAYGINDNTYQTMILDKLTNNRCDVVYDPSRQSEYEDLSCTKIYSNYTTLCKTIMLGNDAFVSCIDHDRNSYVSAHIYRGKLQPILKATEDCMITAVKEAYELALPIAIDKSNEFVNPKRIQREQNERHLIHIVLPCIAGIGTLYLMNWANNKYKMSSRPTSTSLHAADRLEKINYDGEIDHDFVCPIMQYGIMNDPVKANDGITYEREAIETWINVGSRNSPIIPSIKLDLLKIVPNNEIRNRIEDFVSNLEQQHQSNRRLRRH